MSQLLHKIKEKTKSTLQIKTSVELEDADASAYKELIKQVGEKELLSVALDDPKSLRKRLKTRHTTKVPINKNVEMSQAHIDVINGLKDEGYQISEIMTAAIEQLNPKKALKEITRGSDTETEETTHERQDADSNMDMHGEYDTSAEHEDERSMEAIADGE